MQSEGLRCLLFVLLGFGMTIDSATPFNLLTSLWLPVRRAKGAMEWISPAQITGKTENGPIVAFAWPRPDFDLAAHEFVIGLLAVAHPPRDMRDWLRRFHHPPSEQELAAAFAPYGDAFALDGDGPRFLQDFDEIDGRSFSPEALLMDSPGENTIEKNRDLLVKRDRISILSRPAAAMALYAMQQFAKKGGRGFFTSMRGGGPLVTLTHASALESLWQKIWLNTPRHEALCLIDRAQIFPWLGSIAHLQGRVVSVEDMCQPHAFFGMPRRFRLVFERNAEKRPCNITGMIDDVVITGVRRKQGGLKYGVWKHPLTAYRQATKSDPPLALHAPKYRLGYRDWLGLVYSGQGQIKAAGAVVEAKRRLLELEDNDSIGQELILCGGYCVDDFDAVAFVEAEMPLHLVSDDLAQALAEFASVLVNSAKVVDSMLATAARIALLGEKSKADANATTLGVPRERLWVDTELAFHGLLDEAIRELAGDEDERRKQLKESWRETLEKTALSIFDDVAPIDGFGEIDPERIVGARKMLALGLKGYGKYGETFFKELVLPLPEGAKDARQIGAPKEGGGLGMTEPSIYGVALQWWSRLKPDPGRKGDPGALAKLRRGGLQDAALEPATADLYRRLKPFLGGGRFDDAYETAALVAAVLAHVREHDNTNVARAAGATGDKAARVSPLRFRKILAARGGPDCLIAFRRLVALLDKRANVGDLAVSLVEWNRDGAGDKRRTRWAFDYYNAGNVAPEAPDETQDAA